MIELSRDYRLTGPENERAFERGLAEAAWWRPPIDDDRLTELMQRTNARAARDTVLWLGLIIGLAVAIVATWFSWYSVPLLLVYGALYGGAADSRWHEMGHGTAFRWQPANTAIYHLASFMLWRGPTTWRWSHYRHHTDTIIVGRDAEIVFQRPTSVRGLPLLYTHAVGGTQMLARIVKNAFGHVDAEARDFVPESEIKRVVWEGRVFVAVLAASVAASLIWWTPLPVLLVGLPTYYGAWLVVFFGVTQHAGLQEDVLDHRLNTRTVYMNPVFRWLYSNMNYHIEHHIFPGVPYRNLPALHEEIKDALPPALPNTRAAYRELLGALRELERDTSWELTTRGVPDVPSANANPIDVGPMVDDRLKVGPDIDLGPVDAVPTGQVRRVDIAGRTFALYRLDDDEVALSDGLCTHGAAHLAEGLVVDCQIECPKHNGRFDLRTGEPTRKPIKEPLTMYPCEVRDGRVVADLSTIEENT